MATLLDQAIKIGQELEQSDQRLASARQRLEETEKALAARQQELAVTERDFQRRLQSEQTAWSQTKREQETDIARRLADVESREAALKALPDQLEQLRQAEEAVTKREAEALSQWQKAKEAEAHWLEREKELDAKAEAINQLAAKIGVTE